MISFEPSNPIVIFLSVLTIMGIVSLVISMHEASHAYAANKLGDPTARLLGRITLNPGAHIDPIGTVVVPLVLLILTGFVFGWAKPTPINPLNFSRPRQDSALVAFAGPASNFALATAAGLFSRLLPISALERTVIVNMALGGQWASLFDLIGADVFSLIFLILAVIIVLNLILGIFNLLPIPPLDGYRVLLGIVPKETAIRLAVLESYGPLLLIIFIFFFFRFLSPIISAVLSILLNLLGGTAF